MATDLPCKQDYERSNRFSGSISIDKIVSFIVEKAMERNTEDIVRDIYSVYMELGLKISEIFRQIQCQERNSRVV